MAKFEDYKNRMVQQDQALEGEIDAAAQRTEERETQDRVPERFKDKTREEIATAWEEANSTISRQGNELGDLRRQMQTLQENLTKSVEQKAKPEVKPVTVDDIYDNADAAVRRVVREESSERLDSLEGELRKANQRAAVAEARSRFEVKYPEYQKTVADTAFIDWIKASPVRVSLAQAADQGNFEAADELFSTYGELSSLRQKKVPPRTEAARQVSLERSGGAAPSSEKTYSKTELQEKRISAQRGDRKAERWLVANGPEIRAAYVEGRLTT